MCDGGVAFFAVSFQSMDFSVLLISALPEAARNLSREVVEHYCSTAR